MIVSCPHLRSMSKGKDIWIEKGYEVFAIHGPTGVKVEALAKTLDISKSSFYHHFADMEVFTSHLLEYHLERCKIIAVKETNAKNIDPELIDVLVKFKIDLLFNRQLRFSRNNTEFGAVIAKTDAMVGNAFVMLWVKELNLNFSPEKIAALFELALENFYLQINLDNLNHTWLSEYFTNLKRLAKAMG